MQVLSQPVCSDAACGLLDGTLPLVDVIPFHDEIEMLQYRIRLHAPYVSVFVVCESNMTYSGLPKPFHAAHALSALEGILPRIMVVQVPFSAAERRATNPWIRELAQRQFVKQLLHSTFPRHRVYVGDVDELVDFDALHNSSVVASHDCVRPLLRFSYYSERCAMSMPWDMPVLFRTDGKFFAASLSHGYELRVPSPRSPTQQWCVSSRPLYMGWHISYAFSTESIISKLHAFSHASDPSVRNLLNHSNVTGIIERRVRRCEDLFGRPGAADRKVSARPDRPLDSQKLPTLSGWPRHPLAPTSESDGTSRRAHNLNRNRQ